ncbi:hypothetical protein, partial [Acinetobacter baumannii]|uniref:hypothetical protein n=1 Tax=Acinetobacter baumannii TaxID=470 RepID=UPI00148B72CA
VALTGTSYYSLTLGAGVDTLKDDLKGWYATTGGNSAYFIKRWGDYYSLSGTSGVDYMASVEGSNVVELSGLSGSPNIDDDTVKLGASNFAGDS